MKQGLDRPLIPNWTSLQSSAGVQLTPVAVPAYGANTVGSIYYDSGIGQFKVFESGGTGAGAKILCNRTDKGCGDSPTTTLDQAYTNFGTSAAVINLLNSGSRNGIAILDASGGLGTDLFTVADNAGTTKYLNVTNAGLAATGITLSGNFLNPVGYFWHWHWRNLPKWQYVNYWY